MSFTKRKALAMTKKSSNQTPGRVYNRREFNREGRRPVIKSSEHVTVPKDYDWDEEEFKVVLKRFNEIMKNYDKFHTKADQDNKDDKYCGDKMYYECVGYANTAMKFCTRCFDNYKRKTRELYYVDKLHIAEHRRCLCHGCLGHLLRQYDNQTKLYYSSL